MNKNELISKIDNDLGGGKQDVSVVINNLFEQIGIALALGEKVQIKGFGTFDTRKRDAREGVNPRTGKIMSVQEEIVPKFKPGKRLKDTISKYSD